MEINEYFIHFEQDGKEKKNKVRNDAVFFIVMWVFGSFIALWFLTGLKIVLEVGGVCVNKL